MTPQSPRSTTSSRANHLPVMGLLAACLSGAAFAGGGAPTELSLVPSVTSVAAGGTLHVYLDSTAPAFGAFTGLQATIHFDASHLRLDSVALVPSATNAFDATLASDVDNVAGTLRYAVYSLSSTMTAGTRISDLTFTVLDSTQMCGTADLVSFGDIGPFTTRFSTEAGGVLVPVLHNLPAINLDSVKPVLSGVSADITVPTDAGSTFGAYVSLPTVTAFDDCDHTRPVTVTGLPAGSIFPIGTTTVTYSAIDTSGNEVSDSVDVTVEAHQLMDITITMPGHMQNVTQREIRLTGTGITPIYFLVDIDPNGATSGSGVAYAVEVPVRASYSCMSAKDPAHTLTDTIHSFGTSGTRYTASFTLEQGDSSDDDLIDIYDFSIWAFDRGNTDPVLNYSRSNFDGNDVINNADFTCISINFFHIGDSACGSLANPGMPQSKVSVKELRRKGLGHLAMADANRDGWVDAKDIQIYMQGGGSNPATPAAPAKAERPNW